MQADECTVPAGLQVFQTDTDRGTDTLPGAGGVEYIRRAKTPQRISGVRKRKAGTG